MIDLIVFCDLAEMKGAVFPNDLVLNLENSKENCNQIQQELNAF